MPLDPPVPVLPHTHAHTHMHKQTLTHHTHTPLPPPTRAVYSQSETAVSPAGLGPSAVCAAAES